MGLSLGLLLLSFLLLFLGMEMISQYIFIVLMEKILWKQYIYITQWNIKHHMYILEVKWIIWIGWVFFFHFEGP